MGEIFQMRAKKHDFNPTLWLLQYSEKPANFDIVWKVTLSL